MRSQAKYGRFLRVFFLCGLLLTVFGCVALTSAQQAKMDKLQSDLKAAADQVKRIYDLQASVRQKYKDGELDAVEAVGILTELQEEAQHALANYEKLQQDYKDLKGEGIPWYHWLWAVASTIAAAFLGKEHFALKGIAGLFVGAVEKGPCKKVRAELQEKFDGKQLDADEIVDLVTSGIKRRVAQAQNTKANRLVRKLT